METLEYFANTYQNDEQQNDSLYELFGTKVNSNSLLKTHRDDIEKRLAGFGDRPFHYLWYLIITDLKKLNREVNCLEIGVFKGQVISLWSLIARENDIPIKISAISPLDGNYPDKFIYRNHYSRRILSLLSPSFRKDFKNGNIHLREDFKKHIRTTFEQSNLNFDAVELIKGYSNNQEVVAKVSNKKFDLVYIDGDHSYQVAKEDIENYSGLLNKGGYLVMDDSAYFLPGTKFFKGIESCSKAAEEIDPTQFKNILNVGHNRVFEKL